MNSMAMTGTPWLDSPVMLHSSRDYKCKLPTAAMCTYQQGYWRFWYAADWRYALPTVAFFCATIGIFAVAYFGAKALPRHVKQAKTSRQLVALARYLSYRTFRIPFLDWNSAPLGVLLLGAVGVVYFLAITLGPRPYYWTNTKAINFGNSPPLATRAGWLGLACMPFVFATAGKSNLITLVTGVSHERLQTFHRWISYAFYVLGLIHTFPFIVYNIQTGTMIMKWNTSVVYWTGVVALLAQTWLTFASFGPLRSWNYELFKFTHFLAGLIFVVFFFFHCDFRLSSWDYFIATGVLFSLSWLHSQLRTFFENGVDSRAQLSITPNDFVRVSISTRSIWTPGQHYFVRFCSPGLEPWTSHPFTACSLPVRGSLRTSKNSELVFYIRPQSGLTKRLATRARLHPESSVRVLLDGPYGGMQMPKLLDMDRSLVVAGGSGAGWVLPLVEFHLRRLELLSLKNSVAASNDIKDSACETLLQAHPSLRVILATRDSTTRRWFEHALNELFSRSSLTETQRRMLVQVYYTGGGVYPAVSAGPRTRITDNEKSGKDSSIEHDLEKAAATTTNISIASHSSSDTSGLPASTAILQCETEYDSAEEIQDLKFRPDLGEIVAKEASELETGTKLGVFICGPLSMQKDVTDATAAQQLRIMQNPAKEVYLHMEHFAWA